MTPYIVTGIIGFILLILIIILFLPVKIKVYSNDILLYKLKLLFFKVDISIEEILSKKGRFGLDFILSFLMETKKFLRKKFKADIVNINVNVGTADAASTAVVSGTLYGVFYGILSIVDRFIFIPKPLVNINPQFNSATFTFSLEGIIKTRIVHIIATAIIFAYKFFKYKKQEKKEEN